MGTAEGDNEGSSGQARARSGFPTAGLSHAPVDEERRREIAATIPASYNPWLHLLAPSLFGIGVTIASAILLRGPSLLEAATFPITLFLGFGLEWRLHKTVLHRRRPGLGILYERHELTHHVIFRYDDMAMRSNREMLLVLLPPYAILFAFGGVAPLAAGLGYLVSLNAALFFVMASMVFFCSYEWLHLAYHLPADSFVGRNAVVRTLRELHRRHHDPALMKRWNFNVTIPIFDVLHGTLWSPERERRRDATRAGKGAGRAEVR